MLGNYQRYEVTVKFAFEAEVFPEDPDDVYELAELEKASVIDTLKTSFDDVVVDEDTLTVEPIIVVLAN